MPIPHAVDFRLDDFEAATDQVDEAFWKHIDIHETDFTGLAEHHTEDGQHSYYVLHDGSVTWGIPGEPQIVALHIQRDTDAKVFRFQHTTVPLPAMAQSWLIARGCPKERIRRPPDTGAASADDTTRALEERLMADGDHFALLASYTHDTSDTPEITVLLRAVDESEPLPFRVLLERVDTTAWTHTLREGGFSTFEDATAWWEAHWDGEAPALPALPTRLSSLGALPAVPTPAAPPPGRIH
ncbi:hypothetical protein ACIBCM_32210 [Streptomyces sp. NPDC051018]|uniref:hypothetical protein n=1 Tax=Streptomyces sp. NPDC051018 TaxID=3365639 RepID=UPI0037AC6B31